MANKLKDIFSTKSPSFAFKLIPRDDQEYSSLINALHAVICDGKTVHIKDGIPMKTYIVDSNGEYPFADYKNVYDIVMSPMRKELVLSIDTEFGEQELKLYQYTKENYFCLETGENSIISLKLDYMIQKHQLTISLHPQPEKAKSVQEIIKYYSLMLSFLEKILDTENIDESQDLVNEQQILDVNEIYKYLKRNIHECRKMRQLEDVLSMAFNPATITDEEESWRDFEEVYILLIEKNALRLDAKINITNETGIVLNQKISEIEPDTVCDITFPGRGEYNLWGYEISLSLTSLLSNAIVEDIVFTQEGDQKVLLTEDSNSPMYVSYRGFLTEDESKKEMDHIMTHKNVYINALTLNQHITDMIETHENLWY